MLIGLALERLEDWLSFHGRRYTRRPDFTDQYRQLRSIDKLNLPTLTCEPTSGVREPTGGHDDTLGGTRSGNNSEKLAHGGHAHRGRPPLLALDERCLTLSG